MVDVKKTETPDGTPATPNVQREMAKTGRLPGDPVGANPKPDPRAKAEVSTIKDKSETGKPSNVDEDAWEQARHAAENMGGLSGVSDEQRDALIRKQYDNITESQDQLHKWAGDSGILGDDGSKK